MIGRRKTGRHAEGVGEALPNRNGPEPCVADPAHARWKLDKKKQHVPEC